MPRIMNGFVLGDYIYCIWCMFGKEGYVLWHVCVCVFFGCCVRGIYYVRFQFDLLFCCCIKTDINKIYIFFKFTSHTAGQSVTVK